MSFRTNKLKTTRSETFNGLPILTHRGDLVLNYLDRLYDTIDKAVKQYPRTTAIRVDLHLSNLQPDGSSVIKNFIASLDAQIQADLSRKKRRGQTVRSCKVRYVWCKEKGTLLSRHHYHLVLLLNKDVYHSLGRFEQKGNLSDMIKKAWCRTLGINTDEGDTLVHFPKNPTYWLEFNSDKFDQQINQLFKRVSYLAKVETKCSEDRYRSFGCSRT